ncbi:MAG: hypothetical protein ACFFDN_37075 [Candidatus Hodarchaeota archaeon]
MDQADFSHMFKCNKCGQFGAIYLAKAAGTVIVLKIKCPTHGGRSLKISLANKPQYISNLKDGIFRCYKCGAPSKLGTMKVSGPYTLVQMICPSHGSKLPYQKIWTSIYNEITGPSVPQIPVTTPGTPVDKGKVIFDIPPSCPYCKAPISASNAKWSGPASVICPYCERSVPAIERRI